MKNGSVDSLKVFAKCGLIPNKANQRCTVLDMIDPVPYTGRNGDGNDPRRRVPTIDVGGDG